MFTGSSRSPRTSTELSRSFRLLGPCLLALVALVLAPPLPAAPTDPAPPIFDREADGRRQIEESARIAVQSKRQLLVVFGTNECEPCRVANRAIHEPSYFDALIKQFLPVFVDATPGTRNASVLATFRIDPSKGFPVFALFDRDQKPIEVTRNGEIEVAAKKGEKEIQDWLLKYFTKDKDRP